MSDGDEGPRAPSQPEVGWSELAALARARMAEVRDRPEARYRRRVEFYRRHGAGTLGGAGYGVSELSFMRWCIDRGLLGPLDDPRRPGSPYWRATNEAIAHDAELAALVRARRVPVSTGSPVGVPGSTGSPVGVPATEAGDGVRAWLDYLARPSPRSWYRAHNVSLTRGMLDHVAEAEQESREEQIFINEALYRLLYAEALVMGALLGRVGALLADPRLFAAGALVRVEALYPRRYPLREGAALRARERLSRTLGSVGAAVTRDDPIVRGLVHRYLAPMVGGAASGDELVRMFVAGEPVYPGPARAGRARRGAA